MSASWNIELPSPRVEPTPRWIRVRAGETEVANSRRALLLVRYGPGMLPTYCLPAEDVRTDLLQPAATPSADGFVIDHDLRTGDVFLAGAAQLFRDPPPPLEALNDHWTFTWDGGLSWFEEAFEVHVHARDPSKRVDVVPSERLVRVELDGEVVAESRRPHALFETNLPTRWYLPLEDVRQELLVPSDTVTRCPYKGTAGYWSVRVGDAVHRDVAWTYPDPVPECPRIAGLVAFYNERVDLVIDGVRQQRPPESLVELTGMTSVDLEPATDRMARLVNAVPEELLDGPTPCPGYTLGDLLDHVGGLALAFTAAATKAAGDAGSRPPSGDASRLGVDWRTRIPRDLAALAEAWRDPAAWSGTTRAGGLELPGDVAGVVALDELVIHGWDVARASGQSYECDRLSLEVVHRFVAQFAGPGQEASREGLFGPVVRVAGDAPLLDHVIGLSGRDPAWSP